MVNSGRTMPVMSPGDYHNHHHITTPPPSDCAFCGGHITDRFYLQVAERQWHASCLKCYSCNAPLDRENTCYLRDGHIYCKEDYFRQVAVRQCPRCERGVYAADLVMRVRDLVYHVDCFTCAFCNAPLPPGSHFGLHRADNLVYCRPHYEMMLVAAECHPPPPPNYPDGGMQWMPAAFPVGPPAGGRKGRPRKKKSDVDRHGSGLSPMDPSGLHLSHLDSSASSPPMSSGGGGQGRTKRMRTSFKHHQLRTMKSYFAINQNPDAKDLKQLAQKTGLSKRVLQVWFQNARAKWRRNNIKQESMPGMMGSDQSPNSQMHQGGHMSSGMCSPGATSSYSEPSPVHSCGGMASDGSLSTQMGPGASMDFDSSNPMTPLVNHHGLNPGSVHNGETIMHMTSFNDVF